MRLLIVYWLLCVGEAWSACEYNAANDESKCQNMAFEPNRPIGLERAGKRFELSMIRGAIYPRLMPHKMADVRELTIRSSNITTFATDFFSQFPNLETMMIKINHGFPDITPDMFEQCCQHLKTLKIYDNNLKRIDRKIFGRLRHLDYLWIERQNLGPLEPHYFDGLDELRKLKLQHCAIKVIDRDAFDGLRKLVKLELPANQVERIQPGTFKELTRLEELHLDGNLIGKFTGGEFDGLTNLKRLELVGNKISAINVEKILENLPKLERIGIKFTLIECDRAITIMEKIQENNIEIKNVDQVLNSKCNKELPTNFKEVWDRLEKEKNENDE